MKQVYLFIQGDVIGVGFRAWTKIQAKNLGVSGWVKNVGDHVEAVIQGDEPAVDQMVKLVKQGPPVSRVDKVETIEEKIKNVFGGFEIKI